VVSQLQCYWAYTDTVAIVGLGPAEAAPILKQDVTEVPITRPYFDATPDSPLEACVAEAPLNPVFRIDRVSGSMSRTPPFAFRHVRQMPASDPECGSWPPGPEPGRALKNLPAAAEYTHKAIPARGSTVGVHG
jgi:hypothetical protein